MKRKSERRSPWEKGGKCKRMNGGLRSKNGKPTKNTARAQAGGKRGDLLGREAKEKAMRKETAVSPFTEINVNKTKGRNRCTP